MARDEYQKDSEFTPADAGRLDYLVRQFRAEKHQNLPDVKFDIKPSEHIPKLNPNLLTLHRIPEGYREGLKEKLQRIITFLKLPTVSDTFTDHSLRREFRQYLEENNESRLLELIESSQLRLNNLTGVVSGLESALRFFSASTSPELYRELCDQIRGFNEFTVATMKADTYDQLDIIGKQAKIAEIASQLNSILAQIKQLDSK